MIYSISDLHLDFTKIKSMECFGTNWKSYEERIISNWKRLIQPEDLVLIAGDISWQMKLEDAYHDLIRIDSLPGTKIMIRGNHDYWWDSIGKIRKLPLKSSYFIQNDSLEFDNYSICGTRGWNSRDYPNFDDHDDKIFKRELLRLEMSLKDAKYRENIIVMIHYPPFDKKGKPNEFGSLMNDYQVKHCVYGHLHADGHRFIVEGNIDGCNYYCTSGDYINFIPRQIIGE